ncbi:DUF1302 domain-containing protein [Pseudomonas hefeiensis]|uniref:DUF1302 domain-containing protein n=2 Tax=Pseudomonas hefeiensis TaxID=2738125 RepID=A0ABY9GIG2_9PSED|nr:MULTISPECIES: DUF1302 domain-containing protein [unclassified Pseudomonas]WLH15462.1 DUF1302 domain-containing protein [Pseudomonas sp. FP205]WLH98509.1 DUF1302 domain-containing protein [Pseudomonas sp. FP53]WLI42771.1 DUF1302 domain-containing protein [Pseudomonas sp. FP821]
MVGSTAHGFELDSGNPDLRMRWDNTLKYSAGWRVESQSDKLTQGQTSLNLDDGDRNFDKGLISNRLDLLSEFDISYKNVGARVSGAAWYDDVYNKKTDNNASDRINSFSGDHFPSDTRKLHGRKVELLDAFIYGKGEVGGNAISGRVGQYAMQWGESLFFGMNGIAGGMAPIDVVKSLSVPNTQFKELIRPVKQISTQLELTPEVSVGAYYQFEWEANRLPASGSYFSTNDFFADGSERLFVGAPVIPGGEPLAFYHGKDKDAKDSGQGGLQLRIRGETVDWGLYAIRFHDKSPQLNVRPDFANLNPQTGQAGQFYWLYPEGIEAVGGSFSLTQGNYNFAGEVSTRWHQPLASSNQRTLLAGEALDNDNDPLYATGHTLHANLSWLASLEPSFVAQEASFMGEFAWNRTLSITRSPEALEPNADRDAWSMRTVYEPTYRQAFPGLDISIPVGASYTHGNSSALGSGFGVNHGGDLNIGIKGNYLNSWNVGLTYTHFYGPENTFLDANSHTTYGQAMKDRDFVSFSVSRTF